VTSWLFRRVADIGEAPSLSSRFRRRRFLWFRQTLRVDPRDRILDVGGSEGTWIGTGLESQVTILNVRLGARVAPFAYLEADACDLDTIANGAYDVVYSNSVIEHVGDLARQGLFAKEVARVCQRYWVQTPYRHFPIEPHALFPFFQYLGPGLQRMVGRSWKYSHWHRHGTDVEAELRTLRLLDWADLQQVFPDAMLIAERVVGWPKSLIAYRTAVV
jgi:hypothetical protein